MSSPPRRRSRLVSKSHIRDRLAADTGARVEAEAVEKMEAALEARFEEIATRAYEARIEDAEEDAERGLRVYNPPLRARHIQPYTSSRYARPGGRVNSQEVKDEGHAPEVV